MTFITIFWSAVLALFTGRGNIITDSLGRILDSMETAFAWFVNIIL